MSVRVSLLERITHNFPLTNSFTTPNGEVLDTEARRVSWWYRKVVNDFEMIPQHRNARWRRGGNSLNSYGGRPWTPNQSSYVNGSFKDELEKALRGRIRNYTGMSGMRVFEQVEGFYEVEVVDEAVIRRQEARLQRFCELMTNSRYGLIDPLTREERIVDTDYGDKLSYSFMGGTTNPSHITYNVLEASLPELILTDTLLDSHLMNKIASMVVDSGELPELQQVFIEVMKAGETDPVLALVRANAGGTRQKLNAMLEEVGGYDDLTSWANSYEAEEPQFSGESQLEKRTKSITVKQFLSLPFDDEAIKTELNVIRPPMTGLKAGSSWPVSTAGKYVLQLTTKPAELLAKSAGRAWDGNSCESLDSGYGYKKGCFDDIKYGNAIILIYNYSDVINEDGAVSIGKEEILKCLGRFMLRWGDGRDSSGNNLGPRIGVERSTYMVDGKNTSLSSTLGQGVVTILQGRGLWDFSTIRTPYSYRGYSDIIGGGGNITYEKTAFRQTEGGEMGDGGAGAIPNYAEMDTLTFAEFQRIIDTNDSDEIRIAVAENPMIWMQSSGTPRIVGNLMRKIWGFYEAENRKTLIQMLLGHTHASPEAMMDMVDSLEAIDPDYMTPSDNNVLLTFMRHPRTNREIHGKLKDLLIRGGGEELLYRFYLSLNYSLPIYLPEEMWTPVVDFMLQEEVPDSFLRAYRDENQQPMRTANIMDAQVAAVLCLLNQTTMSQDDYNRCFKWMMTKGMALAAESAVSSDGGLQSPQNKSIYEKLRNRLIFSLNEYADAGWVEFYEGVPNEYRQTNCTPRVKENVESFLSAWDAYAENIEKPDLISAYYLIARTSDSPEALQPLYSFAMRLSDLDLRGLLLPALTMRPVGPKTLRPLKSEKQGYLPSEAYVPLIEAMMQSEVGEYSVELLFVSGFPIIRPSLADGSRFDPYRDLVSIFDFDSDSFNPSADISLVSGVKMRGGSDDKYLPADASFALLTNPVAFEVVSLKRVAETLAPVEDLFYIMEEIVFTTLLKDLYTPEGERPFAVLSPEQFNDFQINLTLSNALPRIFEMWEGFLTNSYTPPEIMERLIQKPRLNSVGYRRMFDYFGISGNPMGANSEEWFASNYLERVRNNKGVSGRLLRYLWSNYPQYHETLLMNPNLVESRLYSSAAEEFPIDVLKNDKVGSRAYRKHIRYIIDSMRMNPPSQQNDRSFFDFSQQVHGILNSSGVSGTNNTMMKIQSLQDSGMQFIRAGRYRYSSNLETAPDGPNRHNISLTGSIPEYPQVPTDKPFILFKNYVGSMDYREAQPRYETFEEFLRSTNPYTMTPWESADGEPQSYSSSFGVDGFYPAVYQSMIWGLEISSDEYDGRQSEVPLTAIEVAMMTSANRSTLSRSRQRSPPDLLMNDEDRVQLLNDIQRLRQFEFDEQPGVSFSPNSLTLTIQNDEQYEGVGAFCLQLDNLGFIAVRRVISNTLMRLIPQGTNAYMRFYFPDAPTNLETMFGWIPPEERTELRNFGLSSERFLELKDSLSIFKPDNVVLFTREGLDYMTPVPEGVELIPSWRLGFSGEGLVKLLDSIVGANNLSYMERVEFIEQLGDVVAADGANILPTLSENYGVGWRNQENGLGSRTRRKIRWLLGGYGMLNSVSNWDETNALKLFPKEIDDELRDYLINKTLLYCHEVITYGNSDNATHSSLRTLLAKSIYAEDEWSNGFIGEMMALDESDTTYTFAEVIEKLKRRFRPYLRTLDKDRSKYYRFLSGRSRDADILKLNKEQQEQVLMYAVILFFFPALLKGYISYLQEEDYLDASDLMLAVRFINFQIPADLTSVDYPIGRLVSNMWGSSTNSQVRNLLTPVEGDSSITTLKDFRNKNYLSFIEALDLVRGNPLG